MEFSNNNPPNQLPSNPKNSPVPVIIEIQPIPQKPKAKNLSVLILGFTSLLVLVSIVLTLLVKSQKTSQVSTPLPSPTTSPDPTENLPRDEDLRIWKTYRNEKYAFEFEYPSTYTVIENSQSQITLNAPETTCETGAYGPNSEKIEGRDLEMTFVYHSGGNYNYLWGKAFDFKFSPPQDGQTTIGGKDAYFFYQGAEMVYGRIAYLIATAPNSALEINVLTPELVYNCNQPELVNKNRGHDTANQILSTFRFMD
ncbi:hypothetical protein A3E44_03915 [Candidatus Woesebacteria bacterium RIFCSPHIGHO2_12_FULL_41_24]|uniref:Uncharacterized protein n=1 Tax=Candidatus Woesebacteria bacterium RIFCSPHIGHO2_12_FULL_41_24 TaxID=1802510 RepID=A0A1F8AT60_9BACT|nr:MAG: hypothetical protein A2W15_01400 [Candidatus Woesebacteria bacterium RBG_16_41_13]OGM54937.1 MAG: hypothetical protein A3E44_03915 [Candidatus Woesebacteria bacterium RIFCSPHIGHO2_12_FULL_41_24]OGM74004.1 MAG: hypothetical protein A3H21_04835 [Candidatus Woesebacteria bacterium RIFCSPLOWO2_12_FULL_42_8]